MNQEGDFQHKITLKESILMSIETALFLAQVVVCIFTYNYLGLNLVLYFGWAILVIALILGWRARLEFEEHGKQHEGESWLRTRVVVTSGVYGVVRHPMYLSFALLSLVLVCLSQYWINAVLGVILMGLFYDDMRREERNNIEKFDDEYREYIKQVPRINFVPGIIRLMQRRRSKAA